MDLILLIVIPSAAGLIVMTILIILCCKFRLIDRIAKSDCCHTKAKKPKIEVIIVEAGENKGGLLSSVNHDPDVSKPDPPPPSSTEPDNSASLLSDGVETDKQETVSTEQSSQDIAEIPSETVESSGNSHFSPYISMDRATRGIRKCHTFCGAPSKPYLVHDFVDSELPCLPKVCSSGHGYINSKPIPAGRSNPTSNKDDNEGGMVPTDHQEKAKTLGSVPVPKTRKSIPDAAPAPVSLHRQVLTDDVDLDDSCSESYEDMSKFSLFRSSYSINIEGWVMDDLERVSDNPYKRVSTSRPISYV